MNAYLIKQVDAFTDRAFTGNPAAVLLDASGLSDEQMQLIAREMNLSETAFVLPATDNTHDLELRWFTPTKEVNLCGHATIATFHALAEEKRFGLGETPRKHFRVKTRSGTLPVSVERRDEKVMVKFGIPVPTFEKFDGQITDLFNTLSVPTEQLDKSLPVLISSSRYLYLPFINREPLLKMSPDFQLLKQLSLRRRLTGICVFTTETKHPTSASTPSMRPATICVPPSRPPSALMKTLLRVQHKANLLAIFTCKSAFLIPTARFPLRSNKATSSIVAVVCGRNSLSKTAKLNPSALAATPSR